MYGIGAAGPVAGGAFAGIQASGAVVAGSSWAVVQSVAMGGALPLIGTVSAGAIGGAVGAAGGAVASHARGTNGTDAAAGSDTGGPGGGGQPDEKENLGDEEGTDIEELLHPVQYTMNRCLRVLALFMLLFVVLAIVAAPVDGNVRIESNGCGVDVGPVAWGKDISGQARSLMQGMPHYSTIDPDAVKALYAKRFPKNNRFITVYFPTNVSAIQFVDAWSAAPAPGYEKVSVSFASGN
ncbi:hypothetical protein B0H17DRAFT_4310 [Mycena rosella]|uniref:Uncharacterized protein n=1 Tax=Mycena rosella TaxID=1033263 RepID=A0AAD7H2Y7_MYCRO|nr:hypothetical protein B0H17DRAFT_4310 [Mycena rosella]